MSHKQKIRATHDEEYFKPQYVAVLPHRMDVDHSETHEEEISGCDWLDLSNEFEGS